MRLVAVMMENRLLNMIKSGLLLRGAASAVLIS